MRRAEPLPVGVSLSAPVGPWAGVQGVALPETAPGLLVPKARRPVRMAERSERSPSSMMSWRALCPSGPLACWSASRLASCRRCCPGVCQRLSPC